MWGTLPGRPSRSGFHSSKGGVSPHERIANASKRWCQFSGRQSTVSLERGGTCALSDLHRDDIEGGFERRAWEGVSFLFGNGSVTKVGNHNRSDGIGRGYFFEAINQDEASRNTMATTEIGVYTVSSVVLIEGD
jgi:hypothetical protein